MNDLEAIRERHSVRHYTNRKLDLETIRILEQEIEWSNRQSGLRIQLITEQPEAFRGFFTHYGRFHGVRNYLALVGPDEPGFERKSGYFGEKLVLKAQQLGLNTCWIGTSFRRDRCGCDRKPGERLVCVIAVGYGKTQGVPHKTKPMASLCSVQGEVPDWFRSGMEAAMLAPTARNRQKFCIFLENDELRAESLGGRFSEVDLGIVLCHFELGSGKKIF